MTMLDRMRRHKNWLKWSLGLVVVAFILLYIPDFMNQSVTGAGASPGDVVADVDGRRITVGEFRRVYNAQMQAYRNAYGANINEQMLRQLGIDRQILQQLIDEQAALTEASRLGISASDVEVRERIIRMPGLQENGQFIGEERYRALLRMQRPPISTSDFEDGIRRAIVLEKFQSAVGDWITVGDKDVDDEYRRRNEKVKLDLITFTADKYRSSVTLADADLQAYFESKKEDFRIGEKRKIRFLPISVQAIRASIVVPPADVERDYSTNVDRYSTPEQVRASHILLKTEGKDEATVRKTAEDLLAKIKAGADLGALAKQYSEDDSNKDNGGDLDFFGRGRMVPEFEEAAFALQPGGLSDVVKTQFGFHIIRVTDRRAASVRSLDEVRDQITEQLKWERAQTQAQTLADKITPEITKPEDLDRVATANGLTVRESGLFLRDEPIAGLGPAPEAATAAFEQQEGTVSGAVRTTDGFVFLTVTGKEDSRLPTFDEAKDKVREEATKERASTLAAEKAKEAAASLKAAQDFAKAAKTANLDIQTSELVARGAALPGIGAQAAVDRVAFGLPRFGVSDPIETPTGSVIVRVADRQDVTPDQIASNRDTLRRELQVERRNRFFSSYMSKAKQRMKININPTTLAQLTSTL